jgi:hypothetical protein
VMERNGLVILKGNKVSINMGGKLDEKTVWYNSSVYDLT